YIDGDVLVVNTVKRSVVEANKVLASIGVKNNITVRKVTVSAAELRAAMDAVVKSPLWGSAIRMVAPSEASNSLMVWLAEKPGKFTEADIAKTLDKLVDKRVPIIVFEEYAAEPSNTQRFTIKGAPYISGTMNVGKTIEVAGRIGVFNPAPTSWRYQWLRNGTPISDAKGRTYTIRKADLHKNISVRVTTIRDAYQNRTITTASREVVK
ncbi:MAG: hypothetical protein LBB58_03280, partial [Cellulomonadaceae bacterium]|nr:hypothetical protein [Cellulomonadaceae bacterium]